MATTSNAEAWAHLYERAPIRPARFTTLSGVPLEPVYGAPEGEYPGLYPYTRGIHASMYRTRL